MSTQTCFRHGHDYITTGLPSNGTLYYFNFSMMQHIPKNRRCTAKAIPWQADLEAVVVGNGCIQCIDMAYNSILEAGILSAKDG